MLVDGRKSGQIQVTKTILEKIAVSDTCTHVCTHTQAFIYKIFRVRQKLNMKDNGDDVQGYCAVPICKLTSKG